MICQWSFSFIVFISRVPLTQPAAVYPLHAHLTKSIDVADKKTRKLLSGILATVSQFEVERAVVEFRAAVGAHVTVQVLGKLQYRQIQAQGLGQFARGAQVLELHFRLGARLELTRDHPFTVLAEYGRIREAAG